MKYLLNLLLFTSFAMSYEVANLGSANIMVCSYGKTYKNNTWHIIPEFDQDITYMKVRKGGRVIIAPKGTRYIYRSIDDNGIMEYRPTNGKYTLFVWPTKRAMSVGGTMHNYTDILVIYYTKSGDTRGAAGSCRLEY